MQSVFTSPRLLVAGLFVFVGCLTLCTSAAIAQTPTITHVEEDWELVVGVPAPASGAPQVTCAISPTGDQSSLHFAFMLNQRGVPTLVPGGLQVQAWNGETLLSSKQAGEALLSTPDEAVRWTQSLRLTDAGLAFEVLNGTSATWGEFGADHALLLTTATSLQNLGGYTPEYSAAHSGISYASNRVKSLTLLKVRLYAGDQLVAEDNTPRVVYPATR